MVHLQWYAYSGIPTVLWYAYSGMPTVEFLQWNSYSGIQTVSTVICLQWCIYSGVQCYNFSGITTAQSHNLLSLLYLDDIAIITKHNFLFIY